MKIVIKTQIKGLALMSVLGFLVLATALLLGLLKSSQHFQNSSLLQVSQTQVELNSSSLSDRVRKEILKIVQQQISLSASAGAAAVDLTSLVSPQALKESGIHLEDHESILSVRCLQQGMSSIGICTSSKELPKIFDFVVQSESREGGSVSVIQNEIHIQNASVNSYAFIVKSEDKDSITLGHATYQGLFGINFSNPTADVSPRVKFNTSAGPIIFKNAFITNLPEQIEGQDQLQIPNATDVVFEKGIVYSTGGLGFQDVDQVHTAAKQKAIASGHTGTLSEESVLCSKVVLTNQGEKVKYVEYQNSECQGSGTEVQFDLASNDSLYARGPKVLLEASEPTGIVTTSNIAIVTDGEVELRSSIIRDPSMDGLNGYPSVISNKNLVIGPKMRALDGETELEDFQPTTAASISGPSIQVELTFMGIGSASMVVDSSLTGASTSADAISLGKAVFRGLFISDKAPVTRVVFANSVVDGFEEASWIYPPALQALETDWFSTQLTGGSLVATVTRSETSTTNISEALKAMATSAPTATE